jgi:hypothetical protein
MLINDKLIMPLLYKYNHMQDTKHRDEKRGRGGGIMDINGWGVSHD